MNSQDEEREFGSGNLRTEDECPRSWEARTLEQANIQIDMAEAKIKILEGIRDCYNELVMEVVNKVKGMSRHDRAKAIIISAEQMCSRGGKTGDVPTSNITTKE